MPAMAGRQAWGLDTLLGRLVQVSGGAATAGLTLLARIVLEAQQRQEPVAWIAVGDSLFFPPDFAATGIDLSALPVVQVEKGLQAARAAETLLRGSFALVVLDLGAQRSMTLGVQSRLAGLARRHHSAVVALTRRGGREDWADQKGRGREGRECREGRERDAPEEADASGGGRAGSSGSLGSLVSLHVECGRQRTAFDRFSCELRAQKDKQLGKDWRFVELCRGPDGLC
jgi:recombination protein RecA